VSDEGVTARTHEEVVTDQFGPRAADYIVSAVHATGDDLQQLAMIVRGRREAQALDLGCGGGHVSFTVAPEFAGVTAYDLSAEMLAAVQAEAARRGLTNITTGQGPAEQLPFDDASFDFVLTRFSAHHWHDLSAALGEAHRVTKPGGRAVFIDVVSPGPPLLDTFLQTVELLRDPSHIRDYTIDEWTAAISAAGFTPTAVTQRRLHLDFATWITRMRTSELHAAAIRSLQRQASRDIVRHFAIEPDGTFNVDTMALEATKSPAP
jgi:ubiquinone/menaquinone biosynthesis C-methylase UbiE